MLTHEGFLNESVITNDPSGNYVVASDIATDGSLVCALDNL